MTKRKLAKPRKEQRESGKTFYANKRFSFMGVDFSRGDSFDPSTAGCNARRLRQLFDQRLISHVHPFPQKGSQE